MWLSVTVMLPHDMSVLCMQLKTAAGKKKEQATVQKAKDLSAQREALRIKRAPTAFSLFVKDHYKEVTHLPVNERFKVTTSCCIFVLQSSALLPV